MPTKNKDTPCIEREKIIMKLYLTKSDIQRLLNRSWKLANRIYNDARQKAFDEGKHNLEGRAYYKYVLELAGISENDIHRMAKIERASKKLPQND